MLAQRERRVLGVTAVVDEKRIVKELDIDHREAQLQCTSARGDKPNAGSTVRIRAARKRVVDRAGRRCDGLRRAHLSSHEQRKESKINHRPQHQRESFVWLVVFV